MQPLHYDSRVSAAKDNSITHAAAAPSNRDAALMQPLHYDSRVSAAKDNSITHAAAAPSNLDAVLMQPLQYDSRVSAAKDNSITHAVAATSNFDTAITVRYRDIALQNTLNYAQRREKLQLQNRISAPTQKKKRRFRSTF